ELVPQQRCERGRAAARVPLLYYDLLLADLAQGAHRLLRPDCSAPGDTNETRKPTHRERPLRCSKQPPYPYGFVRVSEIVCGPTDWTAVALPPFAIAVFTLAMKLTTNTPELMVQLLKEFWKMTVRSPAVTLSICASVIITGSGFAAKAEDPAAARP